MKSIINKRLDRINLFIVVFLVLGFTLPTQVLSDEQYRINLKKEASAPISPDQYFEVVFLTARTVFHTLEAAVALESKETQAAMEEVKKACVLIAVVDKMLPETKLVTLVQDKNGNDLYTDVRNVKVREIPIYQGMTSVQVVRPTMKFKKRQTIDKKYTTVSDVDIYSQVWVDIRYFESRLTGAQTYLKANKIDQAYSALADALTVGVRVEYTEAVKEYADAVRYLVLAVNQAEAGNTKEAAKYLKEARKSLSKYAKNESMTDDPDIQDFLAELKAMEKEMRSEAKPGKIRTLWYKMVKKQPRT